MLLDPLRLDLTLGSNQDGSLDSALKLRNEFLAVDIIGDRIPNLQVSLQTGVGDEDQVDLLLGSDLLSVVNN